jgi:hypothetical protein
VEACTKWALFLLGKYGGSGMESTEMMSGGSLGQWGLCVTLLVGDGSWRIEGGVLVLFYLGLTSFSWNTFESAGADGFLVSWFLKEKIK